ncbi:unnamed protein product [Rhizophagus irregularis]|nr:unnamed protein product [Rhizophagus irregularis]
MEPVPTLKIMIKIAVGITAITEKLPPGVFKMNVVIRSEVIIFFKKIRGINQPKLYQILRICLKPNTAIDPCNFVRGPLENSNALNGYQRLDFLEKKECISQLRDVLGSIDMSLEDFELLILMKIRSNKEFHGNKLETRAHTKERFDEYIITISRITAYVIIATSGQESPTRSHIIATSAFRQSITAAIPSSNQTQRTKIEKDYPITNGSSMSIITPGIRIRMRR